MKSKDKLFWRFFACTDTYLTSFCIHFFLPFACFVVQRLSRTHLAVVRDCVMCLLPHLTYNEIFMKLEYTILEQIIQTLTQKYSFTCVHDTYAVQ